MEENVKVRFWKSTWFVVLMCIFFPPIGLVLLWVLEKFAKPLRIALTAFLVFYSILWIGAFGSVNSSYVAPHQVSNEVSIEKFQDQRLTGDWSISDNGHSGNSAFDYMKTTFGDDGKYQSEFKTSDTHEVFSIVGTYGVDKDGNLYISEKSSGNEILYYYTLQDGDLLLQYTENGTVKLSKSNSDINASTSNEPPKPVAPTTATYKPGTYKIGVDMPPGLYALTGPGYVEVSSDSSGDSIIDNDNIGNFAYILVQDGEYLKLSRCSAKPETETAPKTGSVYASGMYKVGKDIPAGEYKVTADSDRGYYERNASAIGSGSDILDNDNFEGSTYVTINDGEYLKLSRCSISI